MVSKVVFVAVFIACAQAAYSQESAASPAQIAYAISQNYDDTGPGANGVLQQTSSPSPQSHSSSTQQISSPAFSQQYQQPQIYSPQHYAQPIQYSQPITYSQPQSFSQPQYSNLHNSLRYQMAHPQISYSLQSPQVYHQPAAQPQHVAYTAQPAYHHPQVQYAAQQSQIAYSQHVKAAAPVKPPQAPQQQQHQQQQQQPESYDSNVQYAYTIEDGPSEYSKNQHDNRQSEVASQGPYSFVLPETHHARPVEYAQEPQNNLLVQRPSHPKGHEAPSSFLSQIHKSQYSNPPVSKPVFSSSIAKPVFAAPIAPKFSSPLHHQYTFSH